MSRRIASGLLVILLLALLAHLLRLLHVLLLLVRREYFIDLLTEIPV